MGYYIQTDGTHGKAAYIVRALGGELVSQEAASAAIDDPTKGVVVVVNNGPFEAAAFAYDRREFNAFTGTSDTRPKKFVIVDRSVAVEKSGFPPDFPG